MSHNDITTRPHTETYACSHTHATWHTYTHRTLNILHVQTLPHIHAHHHTQNEFCAEGGKLNDAVKGVMASTNMLQNSIQLCDVARAAGCKIMHTPITFSADGSDNPNKGLGILKVRVCGACMCVCVCVCVCA